MAIASVADQLASQNKTLVNIDTGITKLSSTLGDFVLDQKRGRLDELEAKRDAEQQTKAAVQSKGAAQTGTIREGFTSGLGMPALAGASFGVGAFLAKGGMRALGSSLLFAASDNIANYIENSTGNSEFADATQRALEGSSLGLLFGPKGALVGAIGGLLITPENADKLKELGQSIGERGEQLSNYLSQLGVTLPDVNDMMTSMANGFGSLVTFTTNLVDGDFKKAFTDFDETAVPLAVAAAGTKGYLANRRRQRGGAPKPKPSTTTPPPAPELTGKDLDKSIQQRTKALSDKQIKKLADQGIKADAKTGALTGKDGKILSRQAKQAALKNVGSVDLAAVSKAFPKFAKLAKAVPFLGTALSIGSIGSVLMDNELDKNQKITRVAGALGGIGGASLGAIAGLMGAPFLGPLAPLAPFLGAGLGAYFGDELATLAANWLVGGEPPAKGSTPESVVSEVLSTDANAPAQTSNLLKGTNDTGIKLKQQNNETIEMQRTSSNGGGNVVIDNSQRVNNTSTGGGSTMPASDMPFDMHDFMAPYGR